MRLILLIVIAIVSYPTVCQSRRCKKKNKKKDILAEISVLSEEIINPVILRLYVDVWSIDGFIVSSAAQTACQSPTGYQVFKYCYHNITHNTRFYGQYLLWCC